MTRIRELRKARGMTLKDMARIFHVSLAAVGFWEQGKNEPSYETLIKMSEYFGVSIDYILGNEPSDGIPHGNWIPVYGNVAAGIPIEEIEDIVDMEEISDDMLKDGSEYMALRIHGESMMPNFREGDHVIVRRQPDVETGDIAIVRVDGEKATCKKIKKTADGIYLLSLNPAYEPIYYTREEADSLPVEILGRVVENRQKY